VGSSARKGMALLRRSLLSLGVLALAACDVSYEAHLSMTVPPNAPQNAESVASDLLSHLSTRFDLRCDQPETWKPSVPSSPEGGGAKEGKQNQELASWLPSLLALQQVTDAAKEAKAEGGFRFRISFGNLSA